jgi:hypothetical protein
VPSGTLAISKTRETPCAYEVVFIRNFGGPAPPPRSLRFENLEDLRAILASIAIGGRDQDKAVRDVMRDGVALVPNVILTEAFIEAHAL